MSDTNLTQILRIQESTWGETPGSPKAQVVRWTGESLKYAISNTRSEEVKSDRIPSNSVRTSGQTTGGITGELAIGSYDPEIASAMCNTWTERPTKDNFAASGSITQVTDSSDTFTIDADGASFLADTLVYMSGFDDDENNGLFKVSSSTGTTIVVAGTPTLVDDASPAETAKIQSVGYEGASGDIVASSTGLTSTTVDFTTLGLAVGQWIKIGGSATGEKFATAACNTWARITAIAAHAITLDNRDANWSSDAGSGKTIRLWFGDTIKPGTTIVSNQYEISNSGQDTVKYSVFKGQVVSSMQVTVEQDAIVGISFDFLGKEEIVNSSTLDASPRVENPNEVLSSVEDLGKLTENGNVLTQDNCAQRFAFTLNNNMRAQRCLGNLAPHGIGTGEAEITGELRAYFGSYDLYEKYLAGTKTAFALVMENQSQAMIFDFPNVTFEDGDKNAAGKNQDLFQNYQVFAEKDTTLLNTHFQISRFSYYE